jgi:hypothetical protein
MIRCLCPRFCGVVRPRTSCAYTICSLRRWRRSCAPAALLRAVTAPLSFWSCTRLFWRCARRLTRAQRQGAGHGANRVPRAARWSRGHTTWKGDPIRYSPVRQFGTNLQRDVQVFRKGARAARRIALAAQQRDQLELQPQPAPAARFRSTAADGGFRSMRAFAAVCAVERGVTAAPTEPELRCTHS